VVGKIPNFHGTEAAADRLAALPAWEAARVLKANPDKAQRAVRARALTAGRVLYMAVPRLADELPFYLLDPEQLSISPWEAATKEGAATAGRKVAATELPSVDLVVCGSVAVNRQGARIGKGGGFSDLEVAFLVEAGVLRPNTVVATTVHPLQVVDEPLPETIHDFRVDLIVTPDEPSGALSRTGHQASSGSTWTRTRSPASQRWRPWQLGVETPRQSAEQFPVVTTFSSHLKAGLRAAASGGPPRAGKHDHTAYWTAPEPAVGSRPPWTMPPAHLMASHWSAAEQDPEASSLRTIEASPTSTLMRPTISSAPVNGPGTGLSPQEEPCPQPPSSVTQAPPDVTILRIEVVKVAS
jgi:5-formyltetrahydrofolate cyclo-ligase